MANIKSLSEIVNEYNKKVSEYKESVVNVQKEMTELIFSTKNYDYITAYERLINNLSNAVQLNRLEGRINSLISRLEINEKNRVKKSAERKSVSKDYISYSDAIELLKENDEKFGKNAITYGGYTFKIRRAADKGLINVERRGKIIKSINRGDLSKLIYDSNIETIYKSMSIKGEDIITLEYIPRNLAAEVYRMAEKSFFSKKNPTKQAYINRISRDIKKGNLPLKEIDGVAHIHRETFEKIIRGRFMSMEISKSRKREVKSRQAQGKARRYGEVKSFMSNKNIGFDEAIRELGIAGREARIYRMLYARYGLKGQEQSPQA